MTLTIAAMPAHDEERAIAKMVLGCKKYVDKVVVVDDGSTDSTVEVAEAIVEIAGTGAGIVHEAERAGDVRDSWADVGKIAGWWRSEVGLTEGLGWP